MVKVIWISKLQNGGGIITAIDYSENAIRKAKKNYRHKNLKFINTDINDSVIGKYDIIVSIGTLEHFDNPFKNLKLFRNHLSKNGKIIITSPNWTNPRGYMLMILKILFNAPITLADLHYFTPKDFEDFAKKLRMKLEWQTIDHSWASGQTLIDDFTRRIPNVLRDMGVGKDKLVNVNQQKIDELINWIKKNVVSFDNRLLHSGATGYYVFSK